MPVTFWFHNSAVGAVDLKIEYEAEKAKLLTLIEHGAKERTLETQEHRVRRLADLLDRTPHRTVSDSR